MKDLQPAGIDEGYLDVSEGGSLADEWPNVISNGFTGA